MAVPQEEVIHFIVTLLKLLLVTMIACIKALIPNGILPRKCLSGDICLITGSGSGLGRLMAVEFAKQGCTLVLWDINEKGNEETKELVEKNGQKAFTYTIDLSKKEQINAIGDKVKNEVGEVSILINNAGIVTGKKIFDCSDDLIQKTIAVNTSASLFTTKNFLKSMMDRNHGHIVTISSIGGKIGTAGLVDYCASKHGAVGLHESLTAELRIQKANGVKTTLVCPFYINTGMFNGVETKSPNLLPILEPSYVVDCIMEAVLTNKEELQIPRFLYWATFAYNLFPTETKHVLSEYYGVYETMDTFVGRKQVKSPK